ncbi:hypothetical protein [Nocardioides sp. SYSU D00065]|nr:hypothetical protein [Nocardioides sp. SYSU D00065]
MTTAPFEPGTEPIPGVPDTEKPNPLAPGEMPDQGPPEPQPTES